MYLSVLLLPPFLLLTESTDDDKVVAWHWEEVKGPLREEKVIADTPVLTLTNLVHGNYTFRYRWTSITPVEMDDIVLTLSGPYVL